MDTDGDGTVLLPPLDPNVRWEVYGVAVNTGWPDPLITPDGTEYHLSPTIILEPGDVLQEGTTFVVARPSGVLARGADGDGNLFPAVMPVVHGCDRGGNSVPACLGAMVTDGDGTALFPPLDPTLHDALPIFAVNTGWPDPLITPDGTEYHLSPTIILEPGDVLQEGTVFVVAKPA